MVAQIVPSELRERQRMPQENKMVAQEVPNETQGPGVGLKNPQESPVASQKEAWGCKNAINT